MKEMANCGVLTSKTLPAREVGFISLRAMASILEYVLYGTAAGEELVWDLCREVEGSRQDEPS